MPVLVIHGDDDQAVPIDITDRRSAQLVPHGTLKVYPGAPHAFPDPHKGQFNADLFAFLRS